MYYVYIYMLHVVCIYLIVYINKRYQQNSSIVQTESPLLSIKLEKKVNSVSRCY